MSDFMVRVAKDYTSFSSGHFITYEGSKCESLHGHNYYVAASVAGPLCGYGYVLDFTMLKRLLRAICDQLDHRVLLPSRNPFLLLTEQEDSVTVRYRDKNYVFPEDDVLLLPISNTTAEMLAEWIGLALESNLVQQGVDGVQILEVEVEETRGQSASWRKRYCI